MDKIDKIYIVDLEISPKKMDYILCSLNISYIPYDKLYELFKDQINEEKFLFDDSLGYSIDENLYKNNKQYFDEEIECEFDFDLFQYSVRLYAEDSVNIKKTFHKELPPYFKT